MEELAQYDEDFFLFLEGGFIAINQADEQSALHLFKACSILRPNNPLIKVGIGYLHLHKMELKVAIQRFEEVLAEDSENALAKTLLGIALSFTPDKVTKGQTILQELSQNSADEQVKKVADTSLDFVDHFIRNPESGARPPPPGK